MLYLQRTVPRGGAEASGGGFDMMPELSLNVLDIAQNSVRADASLTEIRVTVDTPADKLTIVVSDNGCGMTEEQIEKVTDPFFTTRTTRKVGLGVPFFKMAAEITGGEFNITSKLGVGTTTTAVFGLSNIDRMPLGDMAGTISSLVGMNPERDFIYTFDRDGKSFTLDTREFREILGEDVSLSEPDVMAYITAYINENTEECGGSV